MPGDNPWREDTSLTSSGEEGGGSDESAGEWGTGAAKSKVPLHLIHLFKIDVT
jgi:hypothetical protein